MSISGLVDVFLVIIPIVSLPAWWAEWSSPDESPVVDVGSVESVLGVESTSKWETSWVTIAKMPLSDNVGLIAELLQGTAHQLLLEWETFGGVWVVYTMVLLDVEHVLAYKIFFVLIK